MTKIRKQVTAWVLCLISLFALLPAAASADTGDKVTIESERNEQFDYLEYYSGGKWNDLNTPRHWIESTDQVAYCMEHSKGNPHGTTYSETGLDQIFKQKTAEGIETILMFGYPCNTPEGFTEDEARQATANALRFWLSENGEAYTYNFTNRKVNPNSIRAKAGYEHVLTWADELLQMARDHKKLEHSIAFNPAALTLERSGSGFSGAIRVDLKNVNSGYTLDLSGLPEGVTVSGYTGTKSETVTFTAPRSASGQVFQLTATGSDTRALENIAAYLPSGGSVQKICLCATTAQVVAEAAVGVNTPALGALAIRKVGPEREPVSHASFGVYLEEACENRIAEGTTGEQGTVLIEDLPAQTVYVKEEAVGAPYVLDGKVHAVTVSLQEPAQLEVENAAAKGAIHIEKQAEQMVSLKETETQFGSCYAPQYALKGLKGCVFEVYDAENQKIATLTTDEKGEADLTGLELGTYKVVETETAPGYALEEEIHSVDIAYRDMHTPVVTATVRVTNERLNSSVSLKKMTERFEEASAEFVPCPGEGFVFGLYTAENNGLLMRDVLVELLTTGKDGTVKTSHEIPFGRYYLRELASPLDTVEVSPEVFLVTVEGDNEEYVRKPIVNEMFKSNIAIWKTDEQDHKRNLSGAVYEVRNEKGTVLCRMTTDKDGYAVSKSLPAGRYEVQEVVPPTGFILSDVIDTVVLTTQEKNTAQFDRTNRANQVELKKTDLTTGAPCAGAQITVYDASGRIYFEGLTDENGAISLGEVPAGTYTFRETAAPDGYAINPETFTFSIDVYGVVTGDTEITDDPLTLQLHKVNAFTKDDFAGVLFTIRTSDGSVVTTRMTENGWRVPAQDGEEWFRVDDHGRMEFRYLSRGEYVLIEETPEGYLSEGVIPFTMTDDDHTTSPKELTVSNAPTGLKIRKVDAATGNVLTGAVFSIKERDGLSFRTLSFRKLEDGAYFCDPNGTITEIEVDSLGEILFYGLPLGDLWVDEVTAPDGYFPIPAQHVELSGEDSFEHPLEKVIKNSRYVKLGMDSDWWEFPALCAGIAAVLGTGVAVSIAAGRKKRKRRR